MIATRKARFFTKGDVENCNLKALNALYIVLLVCHLYVTRISSVCHSYVPVCHSYATRTWFYDELVYCLVPKLS